jgi:hypothetical protein
MIFSGELNRIVEEERGSEGSVLLQMKPDRMQNRNKI